MEPLSVEQTACGEETRAPSTDVSKRPALAVSCAVFGLDERELKVLLVHRAQPPRDLALPGGPIRLDETLDEAARRQLEEGTGLARVFLEQLYTFGDLDRDPRERTVTVAYYALVKLGDRAVRAATDARSAHWASAGALPPLAFDCGAIVTMALERLKAKVRYQPIGFELLPPKFSLTELQKLYEDILEMPLDKRNFRKKVLSMGLLVALDEWEEGVAHRAARLYRFDRKRYQELKKSGFSFEL